MIYSFLADLLVVFHLVFILYVIAGALLIFKWTKTLWLHLPSCFWGMTVEFTGWICPLTPWEIQLRRLAGEEGYTGSFIEHYLIPVIYPSGLTREVQMVLGGTDLIVNLSLYTLILIKKEK
jgi:hypothetical protein